MKYKYFKHTADIKFQAYGKTIEEAFSNSALAMSNAMFDGKVKPVKTLKIKAKGRDYESLLYNFLEELLFFLDTEEFFLSSIKSIKIDKNKKTLNAEIVGDKAGNYEIHIDVKAITYNEMFVKEEKNKWTTQVVLDV